MQKVWNKSACLLTVVLLLLGSTVGCASRKTQAYEPQVQKIYDATDDWGFEVKAISAHAIALTWNPGRLLTGTFEVQVLDKELKDNWKTLADIARGDHLSRLDSDVIAIPSNRAPLLLHQNLESSSPYLYRIVSIANRAVVSPIVATSTPPAATEGVYVGILSYAGTVEPITQDLILLDPAGKQKIMNSLDTLHTLPDTGSALFYAVHQALTDIDISQWASKIPDRINSTTLITFTDGLDTGSTNTANLPSLKQDPEAGVWSAVRDFMKPDLSAEVNRTSIKEYSRYIQGRLRSPDIHAFSVGVRSQDTANFVAFQETLQSLTSPSGKNYPLDNYSLLESQLSQIMESQLQVFSTPRFTFSMFTPVYPDDTKIRLTFDGKSPTASTKFIDARLVRRDPAGPLVEVAGRNVRLANETVEGSPEGKSEFRFTLSLNEEIDPQKVQQWYIQQTGGVQSWVRNSEHERIIIDNYIFEYEEEKKSNVVYLVLDASASTANDMGKIRNAAKQYIEKLYSEITGIPVASHTATTSGSVATSGTATTSGFVETSDTTTTSGTAVSSGTGATSVTVATSGTGVTTVTVATSEAPPVKEASPIKEAPPVKEAPKAAPAPAVKKAAPAKPLALVPAPSSPAYWVQLGSYREDKNVNEAFRILQSKGYKARIVDDIKNNWRNVQAGPYATQAQADKAARDLRLTPGWFSDCYVYRG